MFLWLALTACDGPTTTEECPRGTPVVEVGTGADAFVPLSADDPLPFVRGPQGGYHVYGSLRAEGALPGDPADPYGPDSPLVTFVVAVDGAEVAGLHAQPRLLDEGPDGATLVGQLVVFSVLDPTALDGAPATFSAELTDRCGATAGDAQDVVLTFAAE